MSRTLGRWGLRRTKVAGLPSLPLISAIGQSTLSSATSTAVVCSDFRIAACKAGISEPGASHPRLHSHASTPSSPRAAQQNRSQTAHKPHLAHSPTATAPEQAMPATVRSGSGGGFAAGSCLVWDTQTHPALQSDAQNEKRILVEVAFSSTPRLARGLLLSVSQKWPLVAQQLRTRHGGGPNHIDAWQWAEENRRRWHVAQWRCFEPWPVPQKKKAHPHQRLRPPLSG